MKKMIIYLLIIMMLVTSVIGVNQTLVHYYKPGEELVVDFITPCYGEINVYVNYKSNKTDGNFDIRNCDKIDNYWSCECINNGYQIVLDTLDNVEDTFNIKIKYYISEPYDIPKFNGSDNNSLYTNQEIENLKLERNKEYSNLMFSKTKTDIVKVVNEIPPFKLTQKAMIVIGIFVGIFLLIILIVLRVFTKEEKPKNKKKPEDKIPKDDYTVDKELNDLLKDL